MDPGPTQADGPEQFKRYVAALQSVRDCYLDELRAMGKLGHSSRALDCSLHEARMARTRSQVSLSRLDVRVAGYLVETALSDLFKAHTRSAMHKCALLQEQKKLEASLGKIQLSVIEHEMVSAPVVPPSGAGIWKSIRRARIFKEIWGREEETAANSTWAKVGVWEEEKIIANSILARIGWWVYGPRLILVFEEARCRSLMIGEEKTCSYFFGAHSVILEELAVRKTLHRQGMHGLFFHIHVSNLFAKECRSRERLYERAFQWPEPGPCPATPVAPH
jgi:hypothetical protein